MTGEPGPVPAPTEFPHELVVGGVVHVVDRATAADVASVVELLRDDLLGAGREAGSGGDDLAPYHEAFAASTTTRTSCSSWCAGPTAGSSPPRS
ncbi:MAG: hypothetical protein ACRCSN_07855 [Dermatophilaceae bacterium]